MNRKYIISEISRDVAQVFFASVVIAPIMSSDFQAPILIAGIFLTSMSWLLSIVISD